MERQHWLQRLKNRARYGGQHGDPMFIDRITRLRVLAQDAMKDYNEQIAAGGEPHYPMWVDDMLAVCTFAEQAYGRALDSVHAN